MLSFYVKLMANSNYATSTIGAYLSDTIIKYACDTPHLLPFTPQVVNSLTNNLTDKYNYVLVKKIITAHGGEKYLIIGNFFPDSLSNIVYIGGGSQNDAYYYIDDVLLTCVDTSSGVAEQEQPQLFSVYPNPNNGNMTLEYMLPENAVFELYDLLGEKVYERTLFSGTQREEINTSTLPNGVYYYRVYGKNKNLGKGKVVVIR